MLTQRQANVIAKMSSIFDRSNDDIISDAIDVGLSLMLLSEGKPPIIKKGKLNEMMLIAGYRRNYKRAKKEVQEDAVSAEYLKAADRFAGMMHQKYPQPSEAKRLQWAYELESSDISIDEFFIVTERVMSGDSWWHDKITGMRFILRNWKKCRDFATRRGIVPGELPTTWVVLSDGTMIKKENFIKENHPNCTVEYEVVK